MANKYVENGIVGINPKYQPIINHGFDCWGNQNNFMKLVNASHCEVLTDGGYNNFFFLASNRYRQYFRTAREISAYVEENYAPATLMKYVRMGLMEMEKGKPNTYCFPADFFISNDLSIDFKPNKSRDYTF